VVLDAEQGLCTCHRTRRYCRCCGCLHQREGPSSFSTSQRPAESTSRWRLPRRQGSGCPYCSVNCSALDYLRNNLRLQCHPPKLPMLV
jgi:hypothetical protein